MTKPGLPRAPDATAVVTRDPRSARPTVRCEDLTRHRVARRAPSSTSSSEGRASRHCPRCHTEARARFPAEMPGPLQYGPGIKAYVVHLHRADALASPNRCTPSSASSCRGDAPRLHRPTPSRARRSATDRRPRDPLRVDRKNHCVMVVKPPTEDIGIIPLLRRPRTWASYPELTQLRAALCGSTRARRARAATTAARR